MSKIVNYICLVAKGYGIFFSALKKLTLPEIVTIVSILLMKVTFHGNATLKSLTSVKF